MCGSRETFLRALKREPIKPVLSSLPTRVKTRLKSLLAPSARVGNVKNNDPSLINRLP